MRVGDVRPLGETQAQWEFETEMDGCGEADSDDESGSDVEAPRLRKLRTNYSSRVVGPWVVGLYKSKDEVSFYTVKDRKSSTLRTIISRCCAPHSVIVTNEWRGY